MSNPLLPPDNGQLLPSNLGSQVAGTNLRETDQIIDLQGQLKSTEDALNEAQEKVKSLESEIKILRENFPIKKSAIKYAKVFLIIIPLVSLVLLIWSALGCFNFGLEKYSESALVIGPIAFVATLLSVMIRSVFNQQSSSDNNVMQSELIKLINE